MAAIKFHFYSMIVVFKENKHIPLKIQDGRHFIRVANNKKLKTGKLV